MDNNWGSCREKNSSTINWNDDDDDGDDLDLSAWIISIEKWWPYQWIPLRCDVIDAVGQFKKKSTHHFFITL